MSSQEWCETTVAELLGSTGSIKTGPFGTMLKASEYSESGVPVISVGEVGYGTLKLRKDTPRVSPSTTSRLSEYVLETNDIVFGRKGAVDRSSIVRSSEDGWFLGSDGIRMRLPPSVNAGFVAYQFQLESIRTWLLQHASGSTMLSLNQGTLERVPLLVPPLADQLAIAEVLDALDNRIASNIKIANTADELGATLTTRAVEAGPEILLTEIAHVTMGSSPAGSSLNENGDGTVFYQGIRDYGLRYPSRRVWTAAPSRMAKELDTLLSVRAPVGSANIAPENICIGRGIASIRSKIGTPYTLFHAVRSSPVWNQYNSEGTVFGSINRKQLESVRLQWVAPQDLRVHESNLTSLEQVIRETTATVKTLEAIRDALLPQLMSGKVRVKDAEQIVSTAV